MSPTINTETTKVAMPLRAFVALGVAIVVITASGVLWTVNLQYGIYKRLDKGITIQEFLSWQRELGKQNPMLNIPNMGEFHFGNNTKEELNGIANAR